MINKSGKFVISLDFELLWGLREKVTANNYKYNILGVWEVIQDVEYVSQI